MMMDNFYSKQGSKVLDPRGMFIVQKPDRIWLWIGKELPACNIEAYTNAAWKHIGLMQQNERAS